MTSGNYDIEKLCQYELFYHKDMLQKDVQRYK